MHREKLADGPLYKDDSGGFWERNYTPEGGRTWKKVEFDFPRTVTDLLDRYAKAEMPTIRFRPRLSWRAEADAIKRVRVSMLAAVNPNDLTPAVCRAYGQTRIATPRAADVEIQALSNAINWAVSQGWMPLNPIRGRTRVQDSADVRHCRECMPANADELHAIARELFRHPLSEAAGWQCIFEAFTGCRGSEVLSLRTDAATKQAPGYMEGDFLYIRRSKGGQWPYVPVHPDLRLAVGAHQTWHASRSIWWIPGEDLVQPLHRTTLTSRLAVVCKRLGLRQVTSHGLRAYFVTTMRSRGKRDEEVAALIGDRTVGLIRSTYGELPAVWSGGEPLGFMPKSGAPAWEVLR